jgi:hypothetical protein
MENILNVNATNIFENCGLKILENKSLIDNYDLIELKDLLISYPDFEICSEETKIEIIKTHIYAENHFRIIDWEFFLPNLIINQLEEKALMNILYSYRIFYIGGRFKFVTNNLGNQQLEKTLNNKDFVKNFSKELQMKAVFSTDKEVWKQIKKEIIQMITIKLIRLNFKEKINVILPKLILDSFESKYK